MYLGRFSRLAPCVAVQRARVLHMGCHGNSFHLEVSRKRQCFRTQLRLQLLLLLLLPDTANTLLLLQVHLGLLLLLMMGVDLELLELLSSQERLLHLASSLVAHLWIESVRGQTAEISQIPIVGVKLPCCDLQLLNLVPQSVIQCILQPDLLFHCLHLQLQITIFIC